MRQSDDGIFFDQMVPPFKAQFGYEFYSVVLPCIPIIIDRCQLASSRVQPGYYVSSSTPGRKAYFASIAIRDGALQNDRERHLHPLERMATPFATCAAPLRVRLKFPADRDT